MIKKWQIFLESQQNVELPLKKYTSLIRTKILNNLDESDNLIKFNFDSTEIELTINWIKNLNNGLSYDISYIYPKLQKGRSLENKVRINNRK